MVRLHLDGLFTCSGVPGGASYETPFTSHQTFAKHVTQIFLCAIKLQKHNFLVTITSTSFFENLSNDFKRSRLTSHQANIHIST